MTGGAIVGIGELAPQRYSSGSTTLSMIAEASILAAHDAGITPDAIDGLLVGPQVGETPQHVPATVAEYLGLRPRMANVVDLGGASAVGMAWRATAAIASGMCETVLCVLGNVNDRGVARRSPNRNPIREFDVPFGASGANTSYAFLASRHMAEYGTTSEQLAIPVVAQRENAQQNPKAVFCGVPLTVDDVLRSPMVIEPLRLLEVVMPCAGAAAFIVTSEERARSFPHPVVSIAGAGEKVTHRAISSAPSLTSGPLKPAIEHAYAQSGMGPGDIDLLQFYDCYSIVLAITMEDAGLCRPGESGPWMAERDFTWRGDTPLNTHGGQLSFGQADLAGGMSHITEAVLQLRHEAEARQVRGVGSALVTGNGATLSEATALVLRRAD
ncbi:acetyl-CoA acetyltransferase [Spinactinospora alkalitolerans]|uniref:Acetyl-CoA acetyltransferase n=1 Tax=Spinactinospora alkalitolerans TaxID=687207 RepID=A0A852U786_9ACTN|nr:thiolase family protein [Spinactinospora alkalitolerans]NYE50733.1 acetyl-CoA acetyltransferase [Spinactinospora alkalitolerans]